MNVNDLICVGAEPLSFVDYVALEESPATTITQVIVADAERNRAGRLVVSVGIGDGNRSWINRQLHRRRRRRNRAQDRFVINARTRSRSKLAL